MEGDGEEECAPRDGRDGPEERLGRIQKCANVVHVLTIAPPLVAGELGARRAW